MKTSLRPELKEPVASFAARLAAGERAIPLVDLARLFGAGGDLVDVVARRGDLVFTDEKFSNDGPDLTVPAGKVELEIPSLIRGTWTCGEGSFTLTFPAKDFTPKACASIAFLRKCFGLKEMRASPSRLELDFGSDLADRCYTF